MIVECPSCSSTFNLDDDLIPDEGRKVRCSVCENVFTARREEAAPPPPPPVEDAGGMDDDDDDDLLSELGGAFDDDDDDDGGDLSDLGGGTEDDDFGAGDDDDDGGLSLDFGGEEKKKKSGGKGKLIGMIVAGVVLVLGLGVGAVWFFAPQMLGLEPAAEETADAEQSAMDMAEQVKKISLESIKQYYVDNDKAGRLFVIQGKAVNLFETPKELIEVEASLYDAQNQELATRRIKCGNMLDLFQLQVLGEEEITEALDNEVGIGSNNVNIQPGKGVSFMIVFFSPPDSLAEFNVKVVAASNVDL